MGISDEIEVATMTIDEATILEIKAMVVLPFQLRLTSFVEQDGNETCKKCAARSDFFFAYFLVSIFVVVAQTELASSVTPCKTCNY